MASLKWIFICAVLLISIHSHCEKIIFSEPFHQIQNTSTTLTIPFYLVKKLIVVKAYVDGKKGNFIIDTGTKSMILNSEYFTGFINTKTKAADFAGSPIAFRERMVAFSWDNTSEKTYSAAITSLSDLEKILGAEIMGYIGYEVLKNNEVGFDYQKRKISLYELDKKGRRKNTLPKYTDPTETIQLKPNGSLPYLTVQLGGQKLKFGIDTGASLNLLKKRTAKKINSHFQSTGFERVAGFSGKESLPECGILRGVKIDNMAWSPMDCAVVNMDDLNRGLPRSLDGLLGFEFLKQYKVSINYRKNEMYVWHLESLQAEAITAW